MLELTDHVAGKSDQVIARLEVSLGEDVPELQHQLSRP